MLDQSLGIICPFESDTNLCGNLCRPRLGSMFSALNSGQGLCFSTKGNFCAFKPATVGPVWGYRLQNISFFILSWLYCHNITNPTSQELGMEAGYGCAPHMRVLICICSTVQQFNADI